MQELLLLMLKSLPIPGERDGLITPVQLFHMDLCKLEKFQMAKLLILTSLLPQSKQPIMLLNLEDKILLMLKRMLINGGQDGLQAQAQFFL